MVTLISDVIQHITSGKLRVDPSIRADLLSFMTEISDIKDDASVWLKDGNSENICMFVDDHLRSAYEDVIYAYERSHHEANAEAVAADDTDINKKAFDDEEITEDEDEDDEDDDDDYDEDGNGYSELAMRLSNLETSILGFSSTLTVGLTACIVITGIMNVGMLVVAGRLLQHGFLG
jgi:hypothetical protein